MQKKTHEQAQTIYGTFGVYRYILALMVIVTHTAPPQWRFIGESSVFAFFILSGYTMAFILYNTYLPKKNGLFKFALNRALRIYPLYWICCVIALLPITFFTKATHDLNPMMGLPVSAIGWFGDITSLFIMDPIRGAMFGPAILPIGWSLGIEITYWALMPALLSSRPNRYCLLIFAICYTLIAFFEAKDKKYVDMSQDFRYFSTMAAAAPFYIGLMLFFRKLKNKFSISTKLGIFILIITAIIYLIAPTIFSEPRFIGLYIFLVLNSLVVAYLSQIDIDKLPVWFKNFDTYCGYLSYPIYLIHASIAAAMHGRFELPCQSVALLIPTLILSTVAAALLHHAIEVPIASLRKAIKA